MSLMQPPCHRSAFGPVVRALILAAGAGKRLGAALTAGGPKCLLPIGGRTLISHQVEALAAAGVCDIHIVVGHGAERVQAHASELARHKGVAVRFIHNERYAETNTLYSMYLGRQALAAPCLCLNGDVLFPASLIRRLIGARGEAALAVDVHPCGDEEMKVVARDGRVARLSKALSPGECHGEFIGVARYGARAARAFAHALEEQVAAGRDRDYYEAALEGVAQEVPLRILPLLGEPVIEIDFPEDYARAAAEIWPRLAARGGA